MKQKAWLCMGVLVILSLFVQAEKLDSYQILAYKIKPAVIRVVAVVVIDFSYLDNNGVTRNDNIALGGTGSGFIFSSEGFIATNGHVIDQVYWFEANPDVYIENVSPYILRRLMQKDGYMQITPIMLNQYRNERKFNVGNRKTFKKVILSNGEIVDYEIKRYSQAIDKNGKDVGILKIERSNLPVVMLGDSNQVEIQEEIQTFGFPGAAEPSGIMDYYINPKASLQVTINRGRISSKKQDNRGVPLIQTDAAIAHGSSGGPAVNKDGKVIGITTYLGGEMDESGQFQQVQGINFIIPINTVKEFIRDVGVAFNEGSEFNDIYYSALDSVWNQDWFNANKKVDMALSLLNDSPDLKELKEKIALAINNMSTIERVWMENKVLVLIVGILVILMILFVFLILKSKKKTDELKRPPFKFEPKEETETQSEQEQPEAPLPEIDDKTLMLVGNIELYVNEEKEGRYPVTEKPLVVGRDPSRANLVIQDPIVSKVHCTFFAKDGEVYVKDNDSTNGVYVNDQRIQEEKLKDGEIITIGRKGNIRLVFQK